MDVSIVDSGVDGRKPPDGETASSELALKPRSYQLEMFERSMKENVLIAMDTGSGKTHIALLRIMAELDNGDPKKRIWFMAPSVALCHQQHAFLCKYLPAIGIRKLLGSDAVDKWSDQSTWDIALEGMRVVVSTPQILHDALVHGFLRIQNLSLLVFDEAHHCVGNNAGNALMLNFYHPTKNSAGSDAVPKILGLSASPIMRSNINDLNAIERNIDCITITPHLCRTELMQYIHHPKVEKLIYNQMSPSGAMQSIFIRQLGSLYVQDPEPEMVFVNGIFKKRKTKTTSAMTELTLFYQAAIYIYSELGLWAANFYITQSIAMLRTSVGASAKSHSNKQEGKEAFLRLLDTAGSFLPQEPHSVAIEMEGALSGKAQRLISFLGTQDHKTCSGLIFVERRVTVSVLLALFSIHPSTRHIFRCGSQVGGSEHPNRNKSMMEMFDAKTLQEDLAKFRSRQYNLLIATNSVEEGIDVTACNLVVCFNAPHSVKSFIQRRGRARKKESRFLIMFPHDDDQIRLGKWQTLEKELIEKYEDNTRRLTELNQLEDIYEHVDARFEIASTGAALTPDFAIAHLNHFCAKLPLVPFVSNQPTFSFSRVGEGNSLVADFITATVVLPSGVDPNVRSATSAKGWRTEKAAAKDAAFQAYIALHAAGLVNDNLLPYTTQWGAELKSMKDYPGIIEIARLFDVWGPMARAWDMPNVSFHRTEIQISENSNDGNNSSSSSSSSSSSLAMMVVTPKALANTMASLVMYPQRPQRTVRATFSESQPIQFTNIAHSLGQLRSTTSLLYNATRPRQRQDIVSDYVALFGPSIPEDQLESWLLTNQATRPATDVFRAEITRPDGLIRDYAGTPRLFGRWSEGSGMDDGGLEVGFERLSRQQNFVIKPQQQHLAIDEDEVDDDDGEKEDEKEKEEAQQKHRQHRTTMAASECSVQQLPLMAAQFGSLMTTILQHIEAHLVAEQISQTLLRNVRIRNIEHVVTAITSSSVQWYTNYERYEFLGDSLLKFITSTQLFLQHGNWHEGYLTERKAFLVSNKNLTKAALASGLEAFIISEQTTARNWAPRFRSEAQQGQNTRTIGTKALADVIEALIAAAYLDSGLCAARLCAHVFLPTSIAATLPGFDLDDQWWSSSSTAAATAAAAVSLGDGVEELIGYQFRNKALLSQAFTHPSFQTNVYLQSNQRLEFLGDAVLDMLVSMLLGEEQEQQSSTEAGLKQGQMTMMKAALVNANILGFFCLDLGLERERRDVHEVAPGVFGAKVWVEKQGLWEFMRHDSREVVELQNGCRQRFHNGGSQPSLGEQIRQATTQPSSDAASAAHPWLLLARLNPAKFYSDLVEAVFGAIYIDSGGDLGQCRQFMDRLGVTGYGRRMMRGEVDAVHPRAELGRRAGAREVQYEHFTVEQQPQQEEVVVEFGCRIQVDGQLVGEARGCRQSRDEAFVMATVEALGKM